MPSLHIWLDADSAPMSVRNHLIRTAARRSLSVTFVANKKITAEADGPFEMVVCPQKKDAADDYIFDHVSRGDLVVTRDFLFAKRLVEKGICTINDCGTTFTAENLEEFLEERELDRQFAQMGLSKHFHEGYDRKKFNGFSACLDQELTRLLRP